MRYFSSPTITTENYIVGKAVINGQLETVLLSDNGEKNTPVCISLVVI